MKRSNIALAVAAALPMVAGSAWALNPATTAAISSADILWVSGSTAIDPALKAFMELGVGSNFPCKVGTVDMYTTAHGYLFSCTGSANTSFSGTNIAIVKQTQGGSAVGIINVAEGVAANFPDITAVNTAGNCGAAVNTPASAPFQAYNTYTCATEASLKPNAGVSDEDPTTFVGTGGVSASDATALTSFPGIQQPFTIVVSKPLRDRLQTAEGLTSGSDAFDQQPSLTHQQIAAVLSGQMLDWGDLWVWDKATHSTQTQVGNGTTSGVHICRRGDTSGTQLGSNIYFFGKGCSKGNSVNFIATPDCATSQTAGEAWTGTNGVCNTNQNNAFVFAGSGTGDVLKCVSDQTLAAGDTVNYRIGIAGGDNKSSDVAATPDVWRFVNIDEQPPTLFSVIQGRYGNVTEDSINSSTASLALNGGPGIKNSILTSLKAIADKAAIAGLDAKFQNSMSIGIESNGLADTGILTLGKATGDPDALTFPLTPAYPAALRTATGAADTGPASTMSKTVNGVLNNCNDLYQVNPTG